MVLPGYRKQGNAITVAPLSIGTGGATAPAPDLSEYATDAEVAALLEAHATDAEVAVLITSLRDRLATLEGKPDPDLTGYAKTADIPDVSGFLTSADLPDLTGYATNAAISALNDRITALENQNWIESTADMTAADKQKIVMQNGHTVNLDETANSIDFAPVTGNWLTLSGTWASPSWDVGRGQRLAGGAHILTLIAQPTEANWLITLNGEAVDLAAPSPATEWISVGTADAPVFQNGWVNDDAAALPLRYRRVGDFIYIEGTIKDGEVSRATSTAFVLPETMRPQRRLTFPATLSGNSGGELDVDPDGEVRPVVGNNASFSFSIQFSINEDFWIEVGTPGAPPYENGWRRIWRSTDTPLRFKRYGNTIHLQGITDILTGASNISEFGPSTIFTLPEGSRPLTTQTFDVASVGVGELEILPDGQVRALKGSTVALHTNVIFSTR